MTFAIMPAGGEADAYALLSLASDPKSTKKRLDDIKKAHEEMLKVSISNGEMLANVQRERFAIAEAQRKLDEAKAEHEQQMHRAHEELAEHRAKVELDRQDAYVICNNNSARAQELLAKDSELKQLEASLAYRETQVKNREDALAFKEAQVESLKQEYEGKLSQLKGLLA